jgi:hypothetical protein
MLEITQRTGRIWSGDFRVESSAKEGDGSGCASMLEDGTGVLSFFFDTDTAEMRFSSEASEQGQISQN